MQIRINLKIFIFLIIFYLTKQIQIYSLIMIFAIIHEFGHLLTGIIMGLKPQKIELMPLGLSVSFKTTNKDYNKKIKKASVLSLKKMIIALAGPITNFIIAILFLFFNFGLESILREQIIYINILIVIFNLIPIYPMDGGRIIKEIVHILKGWQNAYNYTNKLANITIIILTMLASIAIYYFQNIAILFIIIYLWSIVIIENKKYETKKRIQKYCLK